LCGRVGSAIVAPATVVPPLVPYDAYDTDGTPVETNDMVVLAGERYELVYELPAELTTVTLLPSCDWRGVGSRLSFCFSTCIP